MGSVDISFQSRAIMEFTKGKYFSLIIISLLLATTAVIIMGFFIFTIYHGKCDESRMIKLKVMLIAETTEQTPRENEFVFDPINPLRDNRNSHEYFTTTTDPFSNEEEEIEDYIG